MFGVIGRWGNDTEFDIVANAFVSLWKQAGSGEPLTIHMQRYPAVLLLWSYGIGLTLAENWPTLRSLLLYTVTSDYGDPKRIVDLLSEWFLQGNRNNIWKLLPDLQEHKTPAYERLFGISNGWRHSFAPVLADFESLHDLWEILVSLTCAETQINEIPDPNALPFWVPVGRNGWRFQSRNHFIEQIKSGSIGRELVAAGFAGGKQERLIEAANSYSGFADRSHWW